MGRETRGSGSLTRVAIDTAATNGAKDARMSCAISMLCVQAAAAGAQHETDAHADSDWFIRFASDLRLCTLRCGGRAQVLSHQRRRHKRELQRCTRVDLTHYRQLSSDPGHPGVDLAVSSDLSRLLRNACITLPTLAPAVLRRATRDPSTRSVKYKRTVARVRRSLTPAALQVATSTARPAVPHGEAA